MCALADLVDRRFRLVLATLCDDHGMSGRGRAAVLVAAVVAYSDVVRPWLRTWGASRDEVGGTFPGDDLVADRYRTTHAVTIASPPADVWPWLVQMGYRRGGWYSYDRLERAMGRVTSPKEAAPGALLLSCRSSPLVTRSGSARPGA